MYTLEYRHYFGFFRTSNRNKNNFRTTFFIFFLSLSGLSLKAQDSHVQVINMAMDFGKCDIFINDQKMAEAVTTNGSSNWLGVSAGFCNFIATESGSASIAEGMAITEGMLQSGKNYILIFYELNDNGVITPTLALWENSAETLVDLSKIEAYLQELHPNRKS